MRFSIKYANWFYMKTRRHQFSKPSKFENFEVPFVNIIVEIFKTKLNYFFNNLFSKLQEFLCTILKTENYLNEDFNDLEDLSNINCKENNYMCSVDIRKIF